jgi:WD40 repeat protein
MLASGSDSFYVKIWSLPDGNLTKKIDKCSTVVDLALTPDSAMMATGGKYEAIKLWSLPDGALLASIEELIEPNNELRALCIGPDGSTLITASEDKTIRLWSLPGLDPIGCLYDRRWTPAGSGSDAISFRMTSTSSVCTCDTVTVPAAQGLPAGAACSCNTVQLGEYIPEGHKRQGRGSTCSCNTICTCDSVESDSGGGSSSGSFWGGGHYWRSN